VSRFGLVATKTWAEALRTALATVLTTAIAVGCGSPGPASRAAAPPRAGNPAPAAPEPPLPDEAPEPVANGAPGAPQVTIKLLADASRKAHVFWGRKDLGLAPLEIRRPRGSGPLDLLVIAPGFLPLHTRTFTDRDDTLSLRLYDEEAARGLLGHPVGAADPAPAASPGRKIDGATGGPHRRTESGSPGIGSPRAASPERPKTDSAPAD
jgi:hypothetical protein